jgi:ATP-dependent exoDNAse (exonuclease V) beta subunit
MAEDRSALDDLLAEYLGAEAAEKFRPSAAPSAARGPESDLDALGSAQPQFARRGGSAAESESRPAASAGERDEAKGGAQLEQLLAAYLSTENQQQASFRVPRSPEVDELLRRYVLEDEREVAESLRHSLREHVEAPITSRTPTAEWAHTVAASVSETQDLDERVRAYARAVAVAEEQAHAFKADDDSTLKGIPPGNAPPIPLGSPLANQLKRESGQHPRVEAAAADSGPRVEDAAAGRPNPSSDDASSSH